MRVAAFTELVGPDGVTIRERDDPQPDAGEAVIDVEACSINRHDLWILEGDSAMVDEDVLPFVSGLDPAGTVRSVGKDVSGIAPGDRVVLCPNQTCGACEYCREGPENHCIEFGLYHGGLAERARVDATRLVAIPKSLPVRAAAALPTAYVTAWRMLRRANVAPGDLVFVPGATGGVGVATVQLADVLTAETIATSRSAKKLERLADLGADHPIESDDPETLAASVREIGRPDTVINHLGGPFTKPALNAMARGGRMIICGRTAGTVSQLDVPDLFLGHKHVIGSTMGTQGDLRRLVDLAAKGAYEPALGGTYDLESTAEAFADMQRREAFGKLIIEP
jgi:NADPH:quinone reductase-like Zn-dependent oxidoreductase